MCYLKRDFKSCHPKSTNTVYLTDDILYQIKYYNKLSEYKSLCGNDDYNDIYLDIIDKKY
jgi:hypothetical protein